MTITATAPVSGPYLADGSTTTFTRTFLITDEDQLTVYKRDGDTVTEITTGFSHTDVGSTSGTIVFTTAPADGLYITLERATPVEQQSDYEAQGLVTPAQVEDDLDLATMRMQDMAESVGRAVKVEVGSSAPRFLASASGSLVVLDTDGNLVDGPDETAYLSGLSAAETAASRAAESADDIAAYAGYRHYATVALLKLAPIDYTDVLEDDIITVRDGGFIYKVAASGATDHDLATAGGAKLYVQPGPDGNVSVLAFGAVGDGVTDDTDAFQAALDSGAQRVVVPYTDAGYLVGSLTVYGDLIGTGGVIVRKSDSDFHWITLGADYAKVSGVIFDGESQNKAGVWVDGFSQCEVSDCIANNIGNSFIAFNGADGLRIFRNRVYNCGTGVSNYMGEDSAYEVASNNVNVENNTFGTMSSTCIYFSGSLSSTDSVKHLTTPLLYYASISNNNILNVAGHGIICQANHVTIDSNIMVECGAVSNTQSIVPQAAYVTVSNNTIRGGAGVGIDMGACRDSVVIGNQIYDKGEIGIEVQSCTAVTVTGNSVLDCGSGAVGTSSAGISVAEGYWGATFGTDGVAVTGNMVRNTGSGGLYGIVIDDGVTDVVVSGNHLWPGGTSTDIYIHADAAALVFGNLTSTAGDTDKFELNAEAPYVQFSSTNTDADMWLKPQGSGVLKLGQSFFAATTPASFAANKYIVVKDTSGTSHYVPCMAATW